MALIARNIMETQVIKLSPEEPLLTAHRLFFEEGIHGAPVVDDDGCVLGMVTSTDLIRGVLEEHDTGRADPVYLREMLEFSGPDWGNSPSDFQDRLRELTVGDCMTESVVTVEADSGIPEIARAMREHQVHRVLVVEQGELCGIISSFDLIEVLEKDG
jgi:CBS domain-containing protein